MNPDEMYCHKCKKVVNVYEQLTMKSTLYSTEEWNLVCDVCGSNDLEDVAE